jgi:arylsulfatase A-like enzyme
MYSDQEFEMQQFAGCITAMDAQIGRLREKLEELGVAENTMVWFCSDNGPEGNNSAPGQTGGFRGRKRSLHEGGVRVPGLLVWPAVVKPAEVNDPVVTSDYMPTILEAAGTALPENSNRLDGVSILPLLKGEGWTRPQPVAFASQDQLALSGTEYKLYGSDQLYDIVEDPFETKNIADLYPTVVRDYLAAYKSWYASCRNSFEGGEYGTASLERLPQVFPGLGIESTE